VPANDLKASVRQVWGGTVLDLRGEINDFAQEALNAGYTEAEAKNPETILLNFEEVDYINSTGIALILGLLAKARASKPRLLAYGLTEHYRNIFQITRLDDAITIHESEVEAVQAANAL
jgi:anti-sigma B factor antagonist